MCGLGNLGVACANTPKVGGVYMRYDWNDRFTGFCLTFVEGIPVRVDALGERKRWEPRAQPQSIYSVVPVG
jgi:hypothetical protein